LRLSLGFNNHVISGDWKCSAVPSQTIFGFSSCAKTAAALTTGKIFRTLIIALAEKYLCRAQGRRSEVVDRTGKVDPAQAGVNEIVEAIKALAMHGAAITVLWDMRLPVFSVMVLGAWLAGCATDPFDEHTSALVSKPSKSSKSSYNRPLFSPGAKFAGLPPAAQNTIRAQVGVADITDIIKDSSSGEVVYKIYFRNPDAFPTLYVTPNGDVVDADLTVAVRAEDNFGLSARGRSGGLKLSDLPPNVMRVIQELAPNSEVGLIRKETHNDTVVYVVSFKDETHYPRLAIAEDGTVLQETRR
jgi:hypothetical protein